MLLTSRAREEVMNLGSRDKGQLLASLDFLRLTGGHPEEISRGKLRAIVTAMHDDPDKRLVIVYRRLTPDELRAQGRTGAKAGYVLLHVGIIDELGAVESAMELAEARLADASA